MVRTFPYRTATGAVYDSGDYVARLDEALEVADVAGFAARRTESARRGRLRGLGIGPYLEGTGGVPQEFAEVRVLPEGVVEVPIGAISQPSFSLQTIRIRPWFSGCVCQRRNADPGMASMRSSSTCSLPWTAKQTRAI